MPVGKRTFPTYIGTSREWKAGMRKRLRAARRTLYEARLGCFYNPDRGFSVCEAARHIDIALDLCSAKKWGR